MFHAHDRNTPHWAADFVEHIRTVHFALVVICLGLIGLIQFQKPKDVSTAQHQFTEIRKLVDQWGDVAARTKEFFVDAGVMARLF